jgi:hypothetical protein
MYYEDMRKYSDAAATGKELKVFCAVLSASGPETSCNWERIESGKELKAFLANRTRPSRMV